MDLSDEHSKGERDVKKWYNQAPEVSQLEREGLLPLMEMTIS